MREGWEDKKLTEVCRLVNGRAYKRAELLSDGKYPVLRVGNLFTNNQWYYSNLELEEDKYCEDEDLIYAWSASFGPRIWKGEKVIYHYHIWKVIPDLGLVTRDYLYHLFEWDKEKIQSEQGTGTTMMHVSKGSMESRILPIPPLPEQKQIVKLLDQAFEAIDQAKANIEKNIANAKELFDSKKAEYFVRLTLENSLLPVNEACEKIFAGGDKPKPNFSKIETDEYTVPVISNGEKNDGLFGYTNVAKVLKPAITVSARGTIGYTSYRDYPFVPIVRLIVLIPKTDLIDIEFLMYAIKNLEILRTGSSIPQLTVPMINGYSIPVPSREKQKEIVESLNQLEIELEEYKSAMERKKLELVDLKKSILQKAFSGELTNPN